MHVFYLKKKEQTMKWQTISTYGRVFPVSAVYNFFFRGHFWFINAIVYFFFRIDLAVCYLGTGAFESCFLKNFMILSISPLKVRLWISNLFVMIQQKTGYEFRERETVKKCNCWFCPKISSTRIDQVLILKGGKNINFPVREGGLRGPF